MKKEIYLKVLLIIMMIGFTKVGYAQELNGKKQTALTEMQQKKSQQNFYRKTLQIDSVKAMQVLQIQKNYKTSLNSIMADTSLTEAAKRSRVNLLMGVKNQKLRTLLNEAQQQKIIPTTERESAIPTKQL